MNKRWNSRQTGKLENRLDNMIAKIVLSSCMILIPEHQTKLFLIVERLTCVTVALLLLRGLMKRHLQTKQPTGKQIPVSRRCID